MGYVVSAFFRSFLIQSSWSFERMQSLGFFYSISPAIKAINENEEDLKEAYKRHLEFFNTNPYMAPAIIGAAIKLEEQGASSEEIKELKNGLMGAYGAVGDSLFWGSLRPLAAIIGVAVALKGSLWAPIVFLTIYNLPHIFMRCYGLFKGYKMGVGVIGAIKELDILTKVQRIRGLILFLSGSIFSIILSEGAGVNPYLSAFLILSVFGFYFGLEKGIRVEMLAVIAVTVSVVLGLFL